MNYLKEGVQYFKPITLEQKLLIDTLTTRYEGVDAPFVKFEDEHSVTLKVPENIRRKSYHDIAVESQKATIHGVCSGS